MSLRSRLRTAIFIQSTVLVSVVGAAVYFLSSTMLRNNLDLSLVQLARTELASATDIGYVHIHDASPLTMSLQGLPGVEKYALIESSSGRLLAHTANLAKFRPSEKFESLMKESRMRGAFLETINLQQGEIRCVFYPFKDEKGREFLGVVGTPTALYVETISKIATSVLFVVVATAGIALAWGTTVSRKIAAPLEELALEVSQVAPGEREYVSKVNPDYKEISDLILSVETMTGQMNDLLAERARTIQSQRQFIADVSHELRTPISNISGTCEVLLRREREPADYVEAVGEVQSEARRLNRLMNDLLLLARHDIGKFQFESVNYDLVALVAQASDMIGRGGQNRVSMDVELPERCDMFGDEGRVRQAVDNLLKNAMTYAGSRIRLALDADPTEARLSVWNDGPGITDEDSAKIFDRFVRLDGSRSRDTGGSGLGLPIVRVIAEGQGGNAVVRSTNVGVEFVLTLGRRVGG